MPNENQQGLAFSELSLDDRVETKTVPYPNSEYICPSCEAAIPTKKQNPMAKPAKFAHMLNDVQKCPFCSFVFSYVLKAHILRA